MERDPASTSTPLKPPPGTGCFDPLTGLGVLAGLLPSWLGMAGALHWTLDLLSHFRWQYLAASLGAIAWATWRRQRALTVAAALTLLLNVSLLGRLTWPPEVRPSRLTEGFSLRVLSMNVLSSNRQFQSARREIESSSADVVFLMEVNHRWMAELEALKERYPHHLALPREDNFGVALFSRIPWTRHEVKWLGHADVPSVEIELAHQGHDLVLIGTHPLPPVGGPYSQMRNEQLRELAKHVASLSKPVLVVGDLNTTPWSAGMRQLTASGHLGFRSLAPPWTPTWRAGSIFGIPIDHALCTAPLVIAERSVGSDFGSDHRPLLVIVRAERQ